MTVPVNVFPAQTPQMAQGGNLNVQTSATGANFVTIAPQACRQVTIGNNTGTAIEVQQDGAGVAFPVFSGAYFTFYGITSTSQIGVRRVDVSGTQVTVNARWEA